MNPPRPHHQPRQHRRPQRPTGSPVLVGWNAAVVPLDEPVAVRDGDTGEEMDARWLLIFTGDDGDAAAFVVTEQGMLKLAEAAGTALGIMQANP